MSLASLVFLAVGLTLVALPVLALVWIALGGGSEAWPHLIRYVLPAAAFDTLGLLAMVIIGTTVLGAGTAWLTTLCDFSGRKFFVWALMLPLAVPTYIAAYTHVEIWDYAGPVQTVLRDAAGFENSRDYWFPDIRSLGGGGLIFAFVLYPYVYLTSRLTFSMQGASALDVSRSLGAGPWRMFVAVGLPMARPAIAAGVALACMETLNDIGAVSYLGIKTITFAIYDTWLNRDSLGGAVQLALVALIIVALLVWIERTAQGGRSFATQSRERPPARLPLSKWRNVAAIIACLVPIAGGFLLPLYVLVRYLWRDPAQFSEPALLSATGNSMLVAVLTAIIAVGLTFGVLLTGRASGKKTIAGFGRLATLGYAIPGTVLAIGLLVPLAGFDNWFDGLMRTWFGISTGLMISGSIAIIVYACTVRFLAISWGAVETGLGRISPQMDMVARALGRSPWRVAKEVHTPILKMALGAAFLLVFIDTMKELSATLLLRPFGFETLATQIFDKASQSAVEGTAAAALLVVLIGLGPVILLTRTGNR